MSCVQVFETLEEAAKYREFVVQVRTSVPASASLRAFLVLHAGRSMTHCRNFKEPLKEGPAPLHPCLCDGQVPSFVELVTCVYSGL